MASFFNAIASRILRYSRSSRGNLTVVTSIAALPVIAAAGIAIDLGRMSRIQDHLQTVADGAALAAASARNLSGSSDEVRAKRVKIAESFLNDGLSHLTDIEAVEKPVVKATASNVTVSVAATVKGSLTNVLNLLPHDNSDNNHFRIAADSQADWTSAPAPLCILALNPSSEQSLEIQGTADLYAPKCSVWVNSISNRGLYQNGNATLTAATICVTGNYVGSNYQPKPKTGDTACAPRPDPYRKQFDDGYGTAYSNAKEQYDGYSKSSKKFTQLTFTGSSAVETLNPGIYKGGIQVKAGATVYLNPGVYFIQNGKFEVQNATLKNADVNKDGRIDAASEGVTIILTEPDAQTKVTNATQTRLDVQAQSNVHLVATASGPFKGIVIAQHPNSRTSTSKTTANTIIGGGTKSITGVVYYPNNILYVTGGGTGTASSPEKIAADDPLFSIVADKIYIEGNGQLRVGGAGDSKAAGLPPLVEAGSGVSIVSLK
ncbi:TadE/TadG family type IV pilus assembly protein [Aestuariivirga sp.]|uniref:TadE/TadG family type IV pilus assembly protein n=1 Tax=Aestuariivirga sp. TaxID=2650926 RepID=UPI003919EAAE